MQRITPPAKPQRIFWITQKWPLPAEDGARQATYHLVRGLAQSGVSVHLVAIVPPGEPRSLGECQEARVAFGLTDEGEMTVVYREPTRHLKSLLTRPWEPLTFAPYMSSKLAREIIELHASWDSHSTIVFDGLHGAGWYMRLPESERARLKIAHRSHNVESNLWRLGAQQKPWPHSWFLKYQAWLVARFERKLLRASRLTAAVSRDDEQGLQKLYGPGLVTTVTPIGVPLRDLSDGFPTGLEALFVGRLDWTPNRDGLKWFLEQVWPEVASRREDLRLTIAGAGDGSWIAPLIEGKPRVQFLGRVPELAPLYQRACISLVPIFFGSGTRVKAIEASSHARACLSTTIGVEGIGLEPGSSYFRAETREQWIEALCKLTLEDARSRGLAAQRLISDAYDPAKVARRLADSLARLEQASYEHQKDIPSVTQINI